MMNKLEKNKMIAKFMGSTEWHTMFKRGTHHHFCSNDTSCCLGESPDCNPIKEQYYTWFKYHKRWDWLMPVVRKIEEKFDNGHTYFEDTLYWQKSSRTGFYTDIDYVYNKCVEFITIFKDTWIKNDEEKK